MNEWMDEWTNEQWVQSSLCPDALRPLTGSLCSLNQIRKILRVQKKAAQAVMSKCGQNFCTHTKHELRFLPLLCTSYPKDTQSTPIMLRRSHVLFKKPTLDAVPHLLLYDRQGDSGPTNWWAGPPTVRSLAVAFPLTPLCPGIQMRE